VSCPSLLVQRNRGRPRGIGRPGGFQSAGRITLHGWPCPGPVDTAHLAQAFAININLGETDEDVQVPEGTLELEARDQKPASMAPALRDPTRTN
jgi:hypothetical protein